MKVGAKISINFTKIKTLDEFYDVMKHSFGFPHFFGKNINALIDCLFSLRYPQDEMTNIHVGTSEYLLLELKNFSSSPEEIKDILLIAIENVSYKLNEKGQEPSIVLLLK